jgi:outer membrane protein assembly factor BamB
MSSRFSGLLVAALVLTLPGCAWLGSVNPFGGDDEGTGPSPLMDFEPEGRLQEQWDASIGSGLGERYTLLQPAVRNDRIYAADAYGRVESRDLDSGERRWQTRIGTPDGGLLSGLVFWGRDDDGGSFLTGGVGADDSTVFVGTTEGSVVALRAQDGAELWRAKLSSEILAPPASDGERVFVPTLDGRLTALSRSDGSRIWSFATQVPVLSLRGTGTPVVSEPLVFNGSANGRLTALRAEDGQTVWDHVVAVPSGRSELERMADVDSAPLITPRGAYVSSYQGAVKSLRLQDGNVQWERPISSHGSLAAGYGQLYVTDEDGALHALEQDTGTEAWQQDGLLRRGVTGPAVFGAYVAVADADGWLHVFAQSDGRPVARIRVDRSGVRVAPVGLGDQVLIQGNGGRLALYALERSN